MGISEKTKKIMDKDIALAASDRAKVPNKKEGLRLVRRVDPELVNNMEQKYGPEVMTEAAEGFWKDQEKEYPWIKPVVSGGDIASFQIKFGESKLKVDPNEKVEPFDITKICPLSIIKGK